MFEDICLVCSMSDPEIEELCIDAVIALRWARRVFEWKRWASIRCLCRHRVLYIASNGSVCMPMSSITLLGISEKSELTYFFDYLLAVCFVSRAISDRRCKGVVAPLRRVLGGERGREQLRKLHRCCRCCETRNGGWFYRCNGSTNFSCFRGFQMKLVREWHRFHYSSSG